MTRDYRIGERIQDRWLVHDVKRGGMGIVYVVYDPILRQAFAVKTLPGRIRREAIERFREEALLWIRLEPHANVAEARFVEIVDDRPLLFLEYVSGGHLGRWIGTPRLAEDLPRVLRFAIELCDAMVHARRQGIAAHRDLKPQNCLVTADGELKLTDFGLARVAEAAGSGRRHGGTVEYVAPEQWRDFDAADERSDVYSFGILLFEMLTGRLPFGGRPEVEARELERRHRTAVPPAVGRGLDDVIARCLAKSPRDRYASFAELRDRLDAAHVKETGASVAAPTRGADLDARQWNARGASLRALGHGDDALACYERALEIDPSLAHAWSNKAEILFAAGDARAAMRCFERVAAADEDEHVLANRSAIAMHLGDAKAALAAADRSLERNPRLAIAWNNRGTALAALGRPAEAVAAYGQARALDPALDLAWLNEGVALGALGRVDEELSRYDRATRVNPRSAPAWCNRGTALGARGEWSEALRSYRRALRIDRGYADAWFNLGDALADLGRLSSAARAYDRFTTLRPDDLEGWTRFASVLARLGRERKARACRARAVELGRRRSIENHVDQR